LFIVFLFIVLLSLKKFQNIQVSDPGKFFDTACACSILTLKMKDCDATKMPQRTKVGIKKNSGTGATDNDKKYFSSLKNKSLEI